MQPHEVPNLSTILVDLSNSVTAHTSQQAEIECERNCLARRQKIERDALKQRQERQLQFQAKENQSRFHSGLRDFWDRICGEHTRIKQLNMRRTIQVQEQQSEEWNRLLLLQQSELNAFQHRALAVSRHFKNQVRAINHNLSHYNECPQEGIYRIPVAA